MAWLKKKRKPSVCIIGLDGVPHSLVMDLTSRSIMPALAQLIDRGSLRRLRASLPEISAVSWTDFMTGANSGTHGIFGFTDFKRGSYEIRFPNFLDLKCPTFWDRLAEMGKRCIIINQPSTYPARRVNGILISGFVALELERAVYPPSEKANLEKMGYQIDIDTVKARQDADFLWQELDRTFTSRERAFRHFWQGDWDYFELVITGTDRLHHFLWRSGLDPQNSHHQKFLDYYRRIDRFIGEIASAFEKLTGGLEGFYILSDHGFCSIEKEVYLNAWLEREGYLRFRANEAKGLEEIADGSVAFALDPSRIYVNVEGRFPRGIVTPAERDILRKEIGQKLARLEDGGKKVIRHVFRAEEVYSGPLLPEGPDLIVVSEPGFDIKGSVKKREVFGSTDLQGMHTWEDAFVWSITPLGQNLAIGQLAGFILDHFNEKR